jgi:hypothetical protein
VDAGCLRWDSAIGLVVGRASVGGVCNREKRMIMRQSRTLANTAEEEQVRACPLCGEVRTLRGLHGHLRLKHQKEKEEIMQLVNQATPAARNEEEDDTEAVFDLLALLKHLNERYHWIEVLEERGCLQREGLGDALKDSIRSEAQGIVERLVAQGVVLDDADIEAFCAKGKGETEEEETLNHGE